MPIYEYRCDGCEHVFEELQRLSDPDPEACPKCASATVRRLMSSTSFQLKGGGWYVTDYKAAAPGTPAPATPDSPSAASEPGTNANSDSSSDSASVSSAPSEHAHSSSCGCGPSKPSKPSKPSTEAA
ncbi:MAG: zinc ribbon domain-containing protein [Bradymonadaceae bacterium]|nr:zinc ribbon domain-containing protein [Lujinxingiaceae bacterium]